MARGRGQSARTASGCSVHEHVCRAGAVLAVLATAIRRPWADAPVRTNFESSPGCVPGEPPPARPIDLGEPR
eukprot:6542080-Pyramimonas_sp.AAC.1